TEGRRPVEQLQLAARPGQHWENTLASLGDACSHAAERVREEPVLARRSHGDPDRLGRTEAVRRSDDRAFPQQPFMEGPRVLAQLDEDEVRDGSVDRVEPVGAEHLLELLPAGRVQVPAAPQLRLVTEA